MKNLHLFLSLALAGLGLILFSVDGQCTQFMWGGLSVNPVVIKMIAVTLSLFSIFSAHQAGCSSVARGFKPKPAALANEGKQVNGVSA